MATMESYLGDGVYAVYDGNGISLDLRAQDSSKIYLESETYEALLAFVEKIKVHGGPTGEDLADLEEKT